MNVKEYIKSGLVESYVLGMATEAERTEFEQTCASYPEIAEARDAFERALEGQLMLDAVEPPAYIRTRVFETIIPTATENVQQIIEEETPVRRMNVWRFLAAACFAGLLGVGFWAYNTNQKYSELVAKQSITEQELQQSNTQLASLQQEADMMLNPGVKTVALKGTDVAPQAQTTVFWDTAGAKKDVYLMVNNLPQTPSDKQYQLWALLDGKPIDLGMLELKEKRLLVKMKNVQNAQAFAITLEDRGSNLSAPKGQMYVLGNL